MSTAPTKVIEVPRLGGLRITLHDPDPNFLGRWRRGEVDSPWAAEGFRVDRDDTVSFAVLFAVPQLVVAHALAGVDVAAPAYTAGVRAFLRTMPAAARVPWLEE